MIKHFNFSNQKNNSGFFDNIFYIISPLLLIGLYLGYTSYIICLLFIFLRLFSTNIYYDIMGPLVCVAIRLYLNMMRGLLVSK